MTLTGTSLVDAVVGAIAQLYPSATIYDETMKQGAQRPFFFVSKIDTSLDKDLFKRYHQLTQLKVQYFDTINDNTTSFSNLNTIGQEVMECLEKIDFEIGDSVTTYPIRGDNLDYKIIDDILNVFVSYETTLYKQSTANRVLMNQLDVNEIIE